MLDEQSANERSTLSLTNQSLRIASLLFKYTYTHSYSLYLSIFNALLQICSKSNFYGTHKKPKLHSLTLPNEYADRTWSSPVVPVDQLWTAPELLSLPQSTQLSGSKPGDVYSFAIIVQEIVFRQAPFFIDSCALKPEGSPHL